MIDTQGKCIILSAPSGAGKTTIVHYLLEHVSDLRFSVSACSRDPRPNEQGGVDYYFLGVEGFREEISRDAFIEWEEVYKDSYYGTLKREVERIWKSEKAVIFDVDVIGGLNLKRRFGSSALAVFIQPPNTDVLEERLRRRKTESEDKIRQRLEKATRELAYAPEFDVVIVNDKLQDACLQAEIIVREFLSKK